MLIKDAERPRAAGSIRRFRLRSHTAARSRIGFVGEMADAERLARTTEVANVDVLAVRATQLRGFIAVAQGRFA